MRAAASDRAAGTAMCHVRADMADTPLCIGRKARRITAKLVHTLQCVAYPCAPSFCPQSATACARSSQLPPTKTAAVMLPPHPAQAWQTGCAAARPLLADSAPCRGVRGHAAQGAVENTVQKIHRRWSPHCQLLHWQRWLLRLAPVGRCHLVIF